VSVKKSIDQVRFTTRVADARTERDEREKEKVRRVAESGAHYGGGNLPALIADLEARMREAATNLDFETAARIRDELFEVKAKAGREERSRGALAGLHGR
jgi:excinuclease ABC subunit B